MVTQRTNGIERSLGRIEGQLMQLIAMVSEHKVDTNKKQDELRGRVLHVEHRINRAAGVAAAIVLVISIAGKWIWDILRGQT